MSCTAPTSSASPCSASSCPSPSSSSSSARSSAERPSTPPWPTPSRPRCASGHSRGAPVHYTHWFQPLTGSTAEKHDSFFGPAGDGTAITEFSGKDLVRGEPDASSFPTGGIRSTFEARGYTAWDPTSPAFILENPNGAVLCIPTAFTSWTGEALDYKIPLLRSMDALSRAAVRAMRLFGDESAQRVFTTIGCEQEYFLIDEAYYYSRPDLVTTGRTLFGAQPPKGHELDDHYFGSIPPRILAYMLDVEAELQKLGRPGQDPPQRGRPGPVRDRADLRELEPRRRSPAADHADDAERGPRLRARLPAAREAVRRRQRVGQAQQLVDGHGHGRQPARSGRSETFLFFCTAVVEAVNKHQGLLRASIAGAGQDHRLGANEAPPAIISIFMGDRLQRVYQELEHGKSVRDSVVLTMELGTDQLPELPRDEGDRNRTSPFAFTGNKFEFRALGSSQSPSLPNTVLNTIVAEAIDRLATEVDSRGIENLPDILKESWNNNKQVVFDGDNYAEEWHAEAEQRGLLNLRTTPDALPELLSDQTKQVFDAASA